MDINNHQHSQSSYWFVLREDQSNVIFSSNNFTIQNPQSQDIPTRYIVDSTNTRQYIQISEGPVLKQHVIDNSEKDKSKEEDNFWDRNNTRVLLTFCLDNRLSNFRNKELWDTIAMHLGTSPEECLKKYRSLRRTYIRLMRKKRLGKEIKWVHFSTCEEVFKDCKTFAPSVIEPWDDQKVKRLLTLYMDNLHKFRSSRFSYLQKDIWKEIAAQLGTTDYNCYNKFKNLKRAYFRKKENSAGKHIKWQYYNYFERIFYDLDPTGGIWDKNKTKMLMTCYINRLDKFRNPRYQKKELWKEIAKEIGESPDACDRKFRNLKQTYVRLKIKASSGLNITKWRYFKDFETIHEGENTYMHTSYSKEGLPHVNDDNDYVVKLLTFYLENLDQFRDPIVKKKKLWRKLAPKLGMSHIQCDRKFRNLKQTYIRLRERNRTGKKIKWPYYTYLDKIFNDTSLDGCSDDIYSDGYRVDDTTLTEIKRVVQEVHGRKDEDKFETLVRAVEESNAIQRERNRILLALLDKNCS